MKNNASTVPQEKPNLTVVRKEESKNTGAKLVPVKKSEGRQKCYCQPNLRNILRQKNTTFSNFWRLFNLKHVDI